MDDSFPVCGQPYIGDPMRFRVPLDVIPDIKRTKENFQLSKKTEEDIFYDLCFCLCAPQTKWKWNCEANKTLREMDFFHKSCDLLTLETAIKKTRFFRLKAERLLMARADFPGVLGILNSPSPAEVKREWLVTNILGCGMKVASHFLRNQGFEDLAIIDTHIVKFLNQGNPTSKMDYQIMEALLKQIARDNGLSVMELDMYLWKVYSNTSWEAFTI